ncbi:Bax inhibitor-1/YccA family protein [Caulobacter sp. KR2-114]|uniref:Bax inhibitor-1/YccA family protein n=1 Tax=Caulobacter sp. KR2-114 TaxID=3400912 RepID=UPI003C11C6EB
MTLSPFPDDALTLADDRGFHHFLGRVYLQIAGGLGLSAAIAAAVAGVPQIQALFLQHLDGSALGFTALGLVAVFAPLGLMLIASLGGGRNSRAGSSALYWSVCATLGVSLSILLMGYTDQSLTSAFLTAAAAFCAMTVWGLTTRRDLVGWSGFLTLALAGLLVGWLLESFFPNAGGSLLLDSVGVIVFGLLVAVDSQRLRRIYRMTTAGEDRATAVNLAALSLYLNVLNLFELLLSLTGRRRR